MVDEAPKKRVGRPPKAPEDRKVGTNLTIRMRGDLRERLNEAARQSQLSVTEEVERRIEASFATAHREAFENALLGGGRLALLLKDILAVSKRVLPPAEGSPGYEVERRMLVRAIQRLAEFHLPDVAVLGPPIKHSDWEALCQRAEQTGEQAAESVINDARLASIAPFKEEREEIIAATGDPSFFDGALGIMGVAWRIEEYRSSLKDGAGSSRATRAIKDNKKK